MRGAPAPSRVPFRRSGYTGQHRAPRERRSGRPVVEHEGPLTHRQTMRVITGLLAAMFLAATDITVVETAIRTISDDMNALNRQVWVTTAYLVASTVTTPMYGRLSDIYGRRPFFLAAIMIFLAGSALAGAATTMTTLALARGVQGLGAGGLFSLTLSIVGDLVPPRSRARYQGWFIAVFGTSSVTGPVIGGLLAGQSTILGITGWRWVFLINLPIGLFALLLAGAVLRLPQTRSRHRVDWLGAIALTVCLVPLLIYAERGRDWGWTGETSRTFVGIGLVGFGLFLLAEVRAADDALLPGRVLRRPTMLVVALLNFIIGIGMFGAIAALPLYLQIVRGQTPVHAGLMLFPLSTGIALGSLGSGWLISWTGRYRNAPVLGAALLVAGMLLLARIDMTTSMTDIGWRSLVLGLGLGLTLQPLLIAAQNAVRPADLGVSTSVTTFFRQIGGTVGTAVCLSALFDSAQSRIQVALDQALARPEFLAAASRALSEGDPEQRAIVERLAKGGAGLSERAVQNSSFIDRLDPVLAQPFQLGFSQAITVVFVLCGCILVLAQLGVVMLPERRLRKQAGGHGAPHL